MEGKELFKISKMKLEKSLRILSTMSGSETQVYDEYRLPFNTTHAFETKDFKEKSRHGLEKRVVIVCETSRVDG